MMSPILASLVAAIAIFMGGVSIGFSIQTIKIAKLQAAIEFSSNKSAETLKRAEARLLAVNTQAAKMNLELDNANKQRIEAMADAINAARPRIIERVRTLYKTRCPDAVPRNSSASNNTGASGDRADIPERFGEFLANQAAKADKVAVFAETCRKFVADQNCGIVK